MIKIFPSLLQMLTLPIRAPLIFGLDLIARSTLRRTYPHIPNHYWLSLERATRIKLLHGLANEQGSAPAKTASELTSAIENQNLQFGKPEDSVLKNGLPQAAQLSAIQLNFRDISVSAPAVEFLPLISDPPQDPQLRRDAFLSALRDLMNLNSDELTFLGEGRYKIVFRHGNKVIKVYHSARNTEPNEQLGRLMQRDIAIHELLQLLSSSNRETASAFRMAQIFWRNSNLSRGVIAQEPADGMTVGSALLNKNAQQVLKNVDRLFACVQPYQRPFEEMAAVLNIRLATLFIGRKEPVSCGIDLGANLGNMRVDQFGKLILFDQ